LESVGGTTVNGKDAGWFVVGVLFKSLADLLGELSRRREHKDLSFGGFGVDVLERRECECCGFSGSSSSLRDHITPFEHWGNDGSLDWCRLSIVKLAKGLQKGLAQAEAREIGIHMPWRLRLRTGVPAFLPNPWAQ